MSNPTAVHSEETQKTQAEPETAERFIAEKRIGERIRRLRLKKSMGLVELGKHTGLSASFLSQLETGRVVPTLRNLARIAMVFSKDLSYFFETEPTAMFRVHKQKDRVRLPQTGVEPPTYFFESLGYMVPDRNMDPYFAEFIPLAKTEDPRRTCIRGTNFCTCWMGTWSFGMVTRIARWRQATQVLRPPGRRTPTSAPGTAAEMLNSLDDRSRLIVSCGGGMPPHAPTENIRALIATVDELTR